MRVKVRAVEMDLLNMGWRESDVVALMEGTTAVGLRGTEGAEGIWVIGGVGARADGVMVGAMDELSKVELEYMWRRLRYGGRGGSGCRSTATSDAFQDFEDA